MREKKVQGGRTQVLGKKTTNGGGLLEEHEKIKYSNQGRHNVWAFVTT
jgi:hypothetical protein